MARWLQELRVRGWLAHLEHGSTPAHRPSVLAHLSGNRAAVYGLRIPLTPQEALYRAAEDLVAQLGDALADPALELGPDAAPCVTEPRVSSAGVPAEPVSAPVAAVSADTSPSDHPDRQKLWVPGEITGSPSWSDFVETHSGVDGSSRARKTVDNSVHNPSGTGQPPLTALRAGLDDRSGPDWASTVPTSRFAMLIAADWLRRQLPVFGRCSRKLIRHLCKPYWHAGWTNRDIVHAMDHRPGLFGQTPGMLISPEHIAAPTAFIASRLAAWRTPDGAILPGHWTGRVTEAAAAHAARRCVAEHHGRAGAALLRPGERVLTAQHIIDYGHAARPPASPSTRAAAKVALAAALATRHAHRRRRGPSPQHTVTA